MLTSGVLMFQSQWKQTGPKSQVCGSNLSVYEFVKLQMLRLCHDLKSSLFSHPYFSFLFILSTLIKLKRGMFGGVGGKAQGRNYINVEKSMTLFSTVITKMPHQSLHPHLTVIFFLLVAVS